MAGGQGGLDRAHPGASGAAYEYKIDGQADGQEG